MKTKIIAILASHSSDVDAILSTYSISFIIDQVKSGKVVISDECTRELNELI